LSVLGVETSLIGVPGTQTSLTDTPNGLTDLVVPDSPVLENLASSNLEHDKADVIDWRRPIIDYFMIQVTKLIERFGGLLSSLHW
jgi:hypothetical protein